MNTSYRIDVIGHLWSGPLASYSKPLMQVNWDTIGNPDALKPWFGDFESIDDFRITRLEYHFEQHGPKAISTHTEEIMRDWQNEDNAMAFADMHQ